MCWRQRTHDEDERPAAYMLSQHFQEPIWVLTTALLFTRGRTFVAFWSAYAFMNITCLASGLLLANRDSRRVFAYLNAHRRQIVINNCLGISLQRDHHAVALFHPLISGCVCAKISSGRSERAASLFGRNPMRLRRGAVHHRQSKGCHRSA